MPTRRDFVTTMAGAAAGMMLGGGRTAHGRPLATQAPAARREVMIGGRRVRVIDVHAHCVIPQVVDVVKGTRFEKNAAGGAIGILGPQRLQIMDQQGVDVQALSINGYWWYAAERDVAARIVQAQNEGIAKWVATHPDRFVGLASVALQYPDLAAQQLDSAVRTMGFRGASIGGHVEGEDVSLPKYDPFWAKAAELGVVVFMHPQGATNVVRPEAFARGDLGNIMGNPLETAYFLSRLIFDGTFDRFPGLRVCGSHGGGYLPSYFGRTEVACDARPNPGCTNKRRPTEYLRQNILVDTIVFSQEALRHLVAEMGAGQVVYGTDVPFDWPVTVDLVLDAPFLSDADKTAILSGNLIELLRISA